MSSSILFRNIFRGKQLCCLKNLPLVSSTVIINNSPNLYSLTKNNVATRSRNVELVEGGIFDRISNKIKYGFYKQKLKMGGYQLYESVADKIDYITFMTELKMPDTMFSWFLVTELHVWILMVRVMAEPSNGRVVRNHLVDAMWKDVTTRIKKLGSEHSSVARSQVVTLSEQFQAALVSYDEGLGSDIALAGALWRRLLCSAPDTDPRHLEILVRYVRFTLRYLDGIDTEQLVVKRNFEWIPATKLFKEEMKS